MSGIERGMREERRNKVRNVNATLKMIDLGEGLYHHSHDLEGNHFISECEKITSFSECEKGKN